MATDYEGRRPSFDRHGQIRGYRSQAGAPLADPTRNVGSTAGKYGPLLPGLTPKSNWESMFHNYVTGGNSATGAGAPVAATPSSPTPSLGWGLNNNFQGGGTPPVPQDDLPSLATIASGGVTPHQERWAGGPPLSSPDRSMPGAPFMPRGPGVPFTVPKPLSSPTGNAGTDAAELDANKSIYGPGGTSGFWGGGGYAPRQVTPNPLAGAPGGYETGNAATIYQKYGNGSANAYRYSTGNGDTASLSFGGWNNAFSNGGS